LEFVQVKTFYEVILFCAGISCVLNLYFLFFFHDNDEPIPENHGIIENLTQVVKVIFEKKFRLVLLTALFMVIIPSFGPVYNYYYTEYLKFSPVIMGHIHFVAISAYILAIFVVNAFFKGVGFKKFFLITNCISILLYSSNFVLLFRINKQFGISDELFCFSSAALVSFMAELTFLPILALGSRVCPPGLEGTTYAVFTAIFNFAHYLSNFQGAILVWVFGVNRHDFSNLWKLTLIQILCLVVFAFVVSFIKFPRIVAKKPEAISDSFSSISVQQEKTSILYERPPESPHCRSFDGTTQPTTRKPRKRHNLENDTHKSHFY
jgi:Na+/melibiose symporter-like transporter